MLASLIHLWATIRGISFPVTNFIFAWQALFSAQLRGTWLRFVFPRYAFYLALPCSILDFVFVMSSSVATCKAVWYVKAGAGGCAWRCVWPMWTVLPMLLLWPGLCYLYAALCLLLWPGLCGSSMFWTMRLPMLASMIHLWATIRGKSFPVTKSLSKGRITTPPTTPGLQKEQVRAKCKDDGDTANH
jgi:hypothetical protein